MSRLIEGTVIDPFAWNPRANRKLLGQKKAVIQGGIGWPYHGPANYGEQVRFEFELPEVRND